MLLRKIDEQGYFIDDVIVDKIPTIFTEVDGEMVESNDPLYIQEPCPDGLYLPRRVDGEWVEGRILSQTELDEQLSQAKSIKRSEIKQSCYDSITNGFTSTIKYNEPRHYSLTEFKQKNIDDQMAQLQAGVIQNALWHDDDHVRHDVWTVEEFTEFFTQKQMFILNERLKSDALEERVMSATTMDEVNSISYESELTEEEVNINNLLISQMFTVQV